MPKKLNFLGGQQNYDADNGQYLPELKGPNGETPNDFKSFKKPKNEFEKNNNKRLGKVDLADDIDDEIKKIEGDYSTSYLDDDEYIEEYKKVKEKLEKNKDNLSDEDYKSLTEHIDSILNSDKAKGGEKGLNKKLEKWQKDSPEGKVLDKNGKQVDFNKEEKPNQTLKEKWEDYIENAFSNENSSEEGIEKYNKLIEEIEQEMPFESEEEHKKWLDLAATWNGEPEWVDLTEKIIARKDGNKEKDLNAYTDELFKKAKVTTFTSKKYKNPQGEIVEIRRFGEGKNAIRYNETTKQVEQVWINGERVK